MGIGLKGIGLLRPSQMGANLGLIPLVFDPALATFTPHMAKRATSVFATSPIVQGNWDGSGQPDQLYFSRGSQIQSSFYSNFDGYQGSFAFWWTPEKSTDGSFPECYAFYLSSAYSLYYWHGLGVWTARAGSQSFNISHAITAGTRYFIVFSFDTKNTLDGTNYARFSINDAHSFGITTQPTAGDPQSSIILGANGANYAADALIEGLTVYRRPLYDGTYGVDVGNGDEIALIHAAGVGQDPTLVTGSWDVVFCLPTNATAEEIVTGAGEAWSHPHGSEVVEHAFAEDGGYLGDAWAVVFNGDTTFVNCGSDASLDDLIDDEVTIDFWIKADSYGEVAGRPIDKGWYCSTQSGQGLRVEIPCATTNALSISGTDDFQPDGNWHHVTIYFNDAGDRMIYIAIDGIWADYDFQTAGVGAITSDAANNLMLGNNSAGNRCLDGALGWVRISDNDRYSHGTDFVPSRTLPAADGNTVEQWAMNEGTGATAAAVVNSPANDGTISNGTWEEQWDQEGSPIVPYSLDFDGSATQVNCGSAADVDDLHDNAFTAEAWVCIDDLKNGVIIGKTSGWIAGGWALYCQTNGSIKAWISCATTSGSFTTAETYASSNRSRWLHIAITWDDASYNYPIIWVNGIQASGASINRNGAIVTDAAQNLYIGRSGSTGQFLGGRVAWARISDNIRYTDTFTPPSRLNPPAPDGNTLRQFNFRDGAGTTLTDDTATADGTITMGSGKWNKTPDLATDAPGSRVYNWGYTLGADAANEGFLQTLAGLSAGQNYVLRAVLGYEPDARAIPQVLIYDETNSAEITHLTGPSLNGVHDGGNNSATLGDSTARWPQSLVGATLYNITDGSSTTITAISGDGQTITGVLAGGTDDDWDNTDEYMIVPPAYWRWAELFCFELPTIARNGAAADCVSISVKVLNTNDEGVFYLHQLELLENLFDNPSLETGAGAPWIPDGWGNAGLDAGVPDDSEQELTILHSGSSAIKFNTTATSNEGIKQDNAFPISKYVGWGFWSYSNDGDVGLREPSTLAVLQATLTTRDLVITPTAVWEQFLSVWRCASGGFPDPWVVSKDDAAAGTRFFDDIYAFALDDVSLTVTPASLANSTEATGIRVDGRDTLTQPIPAGYLQATQGWIRWNWTPRHDAADALSFGNTTSHLGRWIFDAGHYIACWFSGANTITLGFNDGGGAHTQNWNIAGEIATGITYLCEIRYDPAKMQLIVDGTVRATITTPIDFGASIPNTAVWGSNAAYINQADATYAKP